MARGGRRAGVPGKAYGNRVDLNGPPRPLPVTSAPGQPYGERAALQQAQAQVPMASGDLTAAPPSPSHQDLLAQAQAYQPPDVVPLRAPTQRPGEPLLTPPPPQPVSSPLLQGVALLNSLGANASPEVKALRKVIAATQQNQAAP